MKKPLDEYAKTLEIKVPSIREAVVDKLRKLFIKHPLAQDAHLPYWDKFFEVATKNPEEIKFYISKLPAVEHQMTLKVGLDTNEETGETGFILPITLQQALALHVSFTPEDYRQLCKHAAKAHIDLLQKTINRLTQEKNLHELEGIDLAFAKSIIRDLQPLIDLLNELEKNNPNKNWLEIVQLYFVQ